MQYVNQTCRFLKTRFSEHYRRTKKPRTIDNFLYRHFKQTNHSTSSISRAQRLCDAAILTRCYTQHALQPYIDSEINHIRHFIKIQFVKKGIEFINLPNIFKDKCVISSIPTYFENKEPPIIYYKYNKRF